MVETVENRLFSRYINGTSTVCFKSEGNLKKYFGITGNSQCIFLRQCCYLSVVAFEDLKLFGLRKIKTLNNLKHKSK